MVTSQTQTMIRKTSQGDFMLSYTESSVSGSHSGTEMECELIDSVIEVKRRRKVLGLPDEPR